jgi:small GTP-binding protein
VNSIEYLLSDGTAINCFIYDDSNSNVKEDGKKKKKNKDDNYKNADGCIIVYDISNKKSFEEIKKVYIPKIRDKCKKDIKIILLGNKSDLDYLREVSVDEGSKLALNNHFYFKETSCVENKNVADAFETIIETTNFDVNKKIQRKKGNCVIF